MTAQHPNRHIEITIEDWFRSDINQGGREIEITIEDSIQNVQTFLTNWPNSIEESEKFLDEFNKVKSNISFLEMSDMISDYCLHIE